MYIYIYTHTHICIGVFAGGGDGRSPGFTVRDWMDGGFISGITQIQVSNL